MRFGHINADGDWRWFKFLDFQAELKMPLRREFVIVRKRVENAGEDGDSAYADHIAKEWFRDFKGALDGSGAPLENTEANRKAILQAPDLWKWMTDTLLKFEAWRVEGNGSSGSA